jgi:hypothetical protein
MELDLPGRDQEQAEVSEEVAVADARADHDPVQDPAAIASARPVELKLPISVENHVTRMHVPTVVPKW